jgi:hypothetical protein
MIDSWDRVLVNTCLFYKDTELLRIFKDLRDAGAELTTKPKRVDGQTIDKIFLRRGKIPEDEWKLVRTLKLEPFMEEIKFIFAVTELGDAVVGINLAKPLPEGFFLETLETYYDKIVEAKNSKEFTIDAGGKELTIVPRRTDKDRPEVTVEELYVLKHLQEKGIAKTPEEIRSWVKWE